MGRRGPHERLPHAYHSTGPRTQPGERGTKSFDEEAIAKILCGRLDMNTSTRIHWARALIGGFLAEASVFAIVIPVFMIWGQHALLYAAPSASLVMCFLFALWVGRRLESGFVSHGMLVGVAATFLYVGLTLARPEPFAYLVAHGLKILGGAGGGAFAGWRRAATTATGRPAY